MPEGSENINYIQTADNSLHCILCHTSQISDDFSVPFLSLIISIINNINMLICWFSALLYTVKLRNHKYVNPCTRPSPSPPSSSEKSPPPEEMEAEHNSLRYPWSWPLHPIPPGLPEAGGQAPLRPHRGHPLWTTPAPLTFTVPAYTLTAQLADCKGRLEPKLLSHYFFSRCHSLLSTMPSRWWYCFSLQIPIK